MVKYKDGAMQIMRKEDPWLAATNCYLAGASVEQRRQDERYAMHDAALHGASGVLSAQEAMGLLAAVAQPYTHWLAVYDPSTGKINLAMAKQFDQRHRFRLARP